MSETSVASAPSASAHSYILFGVAGTTYALKSQDVLHIEMIEHVTPVPNAPVFVEGVVFSRGQVLAGLPFGCATSQLSGFSCMSSPPDRTPVQWGNAVRAVSGGNAAPRVQLFHGSSDGTVAFANLAEQVDQWTDVNGIDATADATTTMGSATRREFRDAGQHLLEAQPLAAVEGIGGSAVLATQRAAGEPHEHRGESHGVGFTLQRVENLRDLEAARRVGRATGIGVHLGRRLSRSVASWAASVPG